MSRQEFYQFASSAWSNLKDRNYILINTESEQDKRVLISPFRLFLIIMYFVFFLNKNNYYLI